VASSKSGDPSPQSPNYHTSTIPAWYPSAIFQSSPASPWMKSFQGCAASHWLRATIVRLHFKYCAWETGHRLVRLGVSLSPSYVFGVPQGVYRYSNFLSLLSSTFSSSKQSCNIKELILDYQSFCFPHFSFEYEDPPPDHAFTMADHVPTSIDSETGMKHIDKPTLASSNHHSLSKDDPDNPMNWPILRRLYTSLVAWLFTAVV
jgi:hypothetical protein